MPPTAKYPLARLDLEVMVAAQPNSLRFAFPDGRPSGTWTWWGGPTLATSLPVTIDGDDLIVTWTGVLATALIGRPWALRCDGLDKIAGTNRAAKPGTVTADMTVVVTIADEVVVSVSTGVGASIAYADSRNPVVFRLGRIGEREQTDGCYSTPAFHFPNGYWSSTTITLLSNGNTDGVIFYEKGSQPEDGGIGALDVVEDAFMFDPDLGFWIQYFEATRIGDAGESIQFLADPRYFSYFEWPDDGWRLPANVPTRTATGFEFNVGGTWRGSFWRGVELADVDHDDLFVVGGARGKYFIDLEGRAWKATLIIQPGDGVFPDQGPGSIRLNVTEDFQIGRDIGMAFHDEIEFRDGIDGALVARPRAVDAIGRRAFTDTTGRVWTPGPLAMAGTTADAAAAVAIEALELAASNGARITALEEAAG